MKTFVVTFALTSGGGHQKVTVQARNAHDARKLAEAQYTGAKIISVTAQ